MKYIIEEMTAHNGNEGDEPFTCYFGHCEIDFSIDNGGDIEINTISLPRNDAPSAYIELPESSLFYNAIKWAVIKYYQDEILEFYAENGGDDQYEECV
ncbi:MAG: hypothetical protein RLZZ292_3935 [Bacteroidota bacterium]|jgi:hypothetical protein